MNTIFCIEFVFKIMSMCKCKTYIYIYIVNLTNLIKLLFISLNLNSLILYSHVKFTILVKISDFSASKRVLVMPKSLFIS